MPSPLIICGEEFFCHQVLDSINPADGTLAGSVCSADEKLVDDAVTQTHHAWKKSDWKWRLPHERAKILVQIGTAIEAEAETLAKLQMLDSGKPLNECRKMVSEAAAAFRYYGAVLESDESELVPSRASYVSMTVLEPYGVIGLIIPWNSPIMLEGRKAAPALAAGNAIVIKPSEETPLLALELARICVTAGLPKELITVLNGPGETVGAAVVKHPLIRMISFTGGTQTGRAIGKVCAARIIPAALELGGKSPHIVFADARQDKALEEVAKGIFGSAGQSCVAGSRLLVEETIAEKFISQLAERAENYRVGLPDDPQAEMGPLISLAHRDKVEYYINLAREEGGRIRAGGMRPVGEQFARGAFLQPTVIDRLPNASRAAQEEIFGPVIVCIPFKDEQDLIEQANATDFGLAAGIWSEDFSKAWRIGRHIEAGSIWVNCYKHSSISSPFGGFKNSGIMRQKGRQGLRLYGNLKSVYLGLN